MEKFLPRLPVEQITTKQFLCTLAKFGIFLTDQNNFRILLLLEIKTLDFLKIRHPEILQIKNSDFLQFLGSVDCGETTNISDVFQIEILRYSCNVTVSVGAQWVKQGVGHLGFRTLDLLANITLQFHPTPINSKITEEKDNGQCSN